MDADQINTRIEHPIAYPLTRCPACRSFDLAPVVEEVVPAVHFPSATSATVAGPSSRAWCTGPRRRACFGAGAGPVRACVRGRPRTGPLSAHAAGHATKPVTRAGRRAPPALGRW